MTMQVLRNTCVFNGKIRHIKRENFQYCLNNKINCPLKESKKTTLNISEQKHKKLYLDDRVEAHINSETMIRR